MKNSSGVVLLLAMVLIMAVARYSHASGPVAWATKAPLVGVYVHEGDTGEELLKKQLGIESNFEAVITAIEDRTGKNLGRLQAGETIMLPIPYGGWRESK